MPFDSYENIYRHIAAVNDACYPKIKENVFFLEQVHDKNFVKVMQEIRDAYDHLHHIFMHENPFLPSAQADINSEFEKYRGHMQRLAIETVRKVADYYILLIHNHLEQNGQAGDWTVVKTQIARKVKDARDREVSRNFHERYSAWEEILDLTEQVIKKYSILGLQP